MTPNTKPFIGSYKEEDCVFLLTPINEEHTDIKEKERRIQSGEAHYSEMISHEAPPTPEYLTFFELLTKKHEDRLAREIVGLARHIDSTREGPITILSFARAGTPIGALINRVLKSRFRRDSVHFSISIIRDKGIDRNALWHVILKEGRPSKSIVFVDGWTAKGVITQEFRKCVDEWNHEYSPAFRLRDDLYVISDIGGVANVCATRDDYAIPSGILNAPVSGLVSRSILNDKIAPDQFHGAVYYEHLTLYDRTNWFLDRIFQASKNKVAWPELPGFGSARRAQDRMRRFLDTVKAKYDVTDINMIKPGIAEATRVMMRRVPRLLMLREPGNTIDVEHLLILAKEKCVLVAVDHGMPFGATALISNQNDS